MTRPPLPDIWTIAGPISTGSLYRFSRPRSPPLKKHVPERENCGCFRREREANMRNIKLKLALLVVLMCLAFASAAVAVKPLVYKAEKTREIHAEIREFHETVEESKQEAKQQAVSLPYGQLLEAAQYYNMSLYANEQCDLNSRSAYEVSQFKLTDYGVPDETFGILSIPKMDLEMPLYLGASNENMANGAAVLSQTSLPIGGINTNAVIAGHRGYGGYSYFRYIELLEPGDEVTITNLWKTLKYTVTDIKIVTPDDVQSILIQPGKDMITLLTCHPYASGGKYRYLVFCERVIE